MNPKRMKKAIGLCFALTFLLVLLTVGAEAVEIVDSGYCGGEGDGTNLNWTLDSDGVLTISGTGKMADYNYSDQPPWRSRRFEIQRGIVLPGVTCIGYYAFWDCSCMTSISIPDSVISIRDYAFWGCNSLTSFDVPESLTSIENHVFSECSSLTAISIPDSVASIGDGAFSGCSGLLSISVPEGVTNIGNGAFFRCSSLTSMAIPGGVTSVGDITFYECSDLTSITIPESVTYIGAKAFYGCRSLESIPIPRGVTSIGDGAFKACLSLKNITIPEGVTSIGDSTFESCNSLTGIIIPESVSGIGDSAFAFCDSLVSITVPRGVTSIGEKTFQGCRSLTSITIPEGVTSIGWWAFSDCTSIESISIPQGVVKIGRYSFSDCSSLESITIPRSVSRIELEAFAGCRSLTDVYYIGNTSSWKTISTESKNDPLLNATIHYGDPTENLPTASRYVPYSEAIPAAHGDSNFALTSGALPEGMNLGTDGVLSGIPTELGSFSFKVTETYDGGTITHECSLFVYTQYSMDVEAFNEPGYGFVETAGDDGRVQNQTVSSKEELKDQIMHLEGAFSEFCSLYLDARQLTRDVDYTAEEGSTKLTILAETIGEAGGGTHTLAAEFLTADSTAPSGSRSVFTVQNYTVAGIASKEVHVTVEGELVLWTDAEPYIDTNNRTMTPFRAVGEALGLSVAWDSSTREASFTDGAKTIYFPIGSTTARTSDGGTVTMDTSAVIVNGRTYAPIRYLAEFFGWGVSWDGKTRTAAIG